jgi:hypothetical protein
MPKRQDPATPTKEDVGEERAGSPVSKQRAKRLFHGEKAMDVDAATADTRDRNERANERDKRRERIERQKKTGVKDRSKKGGRKSRMMIVWMGITSQPLPLMETTDVQMPGNHPAPSALLPRSVLISIKPFLLRLRARVADAALPRLPRSQDSPGPTA